MHNNLRPDSLNGSLHELIKARAAERGYSFDKPDTLDADDTEEITQDDIREHYEYLYGSPEDESEGEDFVQQGCECVSPTPKSEKGDIQNSERARDAEYREKQPLDEFSKRLNEISL